MPDVDDSSVVVRCDACDSPLEKTGFFDDGGGMFTQYVRPCLYCLDREREEGYEEGYRVGYDEGREAEA